MTNIDFRSHSQMLRSNCWSLEMLSFQYLAWKLPNLIQRMFLVRSYIDDPNLCSDQRSRSNSWSSNKYSAQHLKRTFILEQCLHRVRVDDPNWFSGRLFKGQCQTIDLHLNCWVLNNSWPFFLMVTILATLDDFVEKIIPIALCVKANVKILVFISAMYAQYLMNQLLDNYLTWYSDLD